MRHHIVMAGLVPAISIKWHSVPWRRDARHKAGHDGSECAALGPQSGQQRIDGLALAAKRCDVIFALGLALMLLGPAVDTAWAQKHSPKIWDVQLGTPVSELPEEEFV